jgi:hypothetical protein
LGFRFTLHEQKDAVWGVPQSNGIYNGFLGEIQNGRANWSVAEITFTDERNKVFDFSVPIINQPKKIVTRRPGEDFDTSAYFIVFSLQFWIVLIISAIIITFFIFFILRFDSVDDKHQSNRMAAAFSFTMLSLLCRESCVLDANWSGKILFLVVLLWGFLISVSYNAILTSVLASSRTTPPINSLEELLNSHYTLVFRFGGSTRDNFKNAPTHSIGKLFILDLN